MTAAEVGQAYAAIHDAVVRLAGVCDFAESLDGQGFNATDTWLGHVLAAMPVGSWSDDEALAAWDMLRKYRGQLDGLGISYDGLPRPPGAGDLEAARREEARQRVRQRGRKWREEQYRKARSYLRCDGPGEKVTLAFPFDPAMVDAAKAIKGRHFDWDTKTNVYPFTSLPQTVAFAEAHGIDITPEVRALVPAAIAQAEQEAARPNVHTDAAGRLVITAEYDPALNEALKKLNGGRSTWDSRARVHRPPIHRDPGRVLEIAAQFGLSVGDDARAVIGAETARQERNKAAASAFEADPVPVPGLAEGLALKPQQYPVLRFALEYRRVLVGDDMGWGKTLSSLAAVAADAAYPAVVVCRPSLTLNWVAEIRRFFPGLAIFEASGTTPQPLPGSTDVIVIGSAALAAKPRQTKAGGKEFGWVKALTAAAPKALIIDEGQDTKERGANRSQACEQLAAAVTGHDGLVLDLTGTAILNRPRELCQQLSILGRLGEFGGPKAFLWRYCLSETNEWGASYNGARNLTELHERLLRWGIMVRRSSDEALGLPPCREHVLRIPRAQLDPAVMARYRQAEADLLGYLASQARETAERLGTDPTHAAVQAAIRAQAAEHLVAINTLRQLAGQAKRGHVTDWVHEQVAAGEKVMVAAHHRGEVNAYAAAFGGLKLQGGQPVAEKEAAKATFQQQPAAQAPVIAVAIGAGGVGHTLTAARIGIQAEQTWTPGETQQMKKRLHRIGQDRPVDYYITVAEHTIDEHLWAVVTAKQATLNAVLDGKSDEGTADDEASVVAEVAWRLAQEGLTGTPAAQPQRQEVSTKGERLGGAPQRSPGLTDPPDGNAQPPAAADDSAPAATSGSVTGSVLDDVSLARMRAEAAAEASPFVNPALLRDAETVLSLVPGNWLSRVVGHAVASYRSLANDELALAVRAALADSAHLESLAAQRHAEHKRADRLAAEAAVARAQEERDRWEALKAQLPVPVAVEHNWTARHLDGYEQGADHIVVLEDLNAGRYHRSAGDPLCWTPSRAHQLRYVHANAGNERRIPDCKACLKHAERILLPAEAAGRDPAREQGTGKQTAPAAGTVPTAVVPESRAAANQKPGKDCEEPGRATSSPPAVSTRWTATCTRCHTEPPGPGGILCPACKVAIAARDSRPSTGPESADDDGDDDPAAARGFALREAAHLYLDRGLLPVPGWAAKATGECCCRRGGDCPRPGKHPRSVHVGPGPYDYSWKPLACHTHEEIEQRFAHYGEYAAANLMLAIPEGMLVIDQDNDDGGQQAMATLTRQLGELPPTMSHATPHGAHRIYRTPPGWTGRAWVGKDASNPLPPGIDLRVPGQILMAPPSRVPVPGGLAAYGPAAGSAVADLPVAYVTAWTPPQAQAPGQRRRIPVPPGKADQATAYVTAKIEGILGDLSTHEPGGRNTAVYNAALKVGSTLGAARATPGAEHAAAAWSDQDAEDALMEAAERNGYLRKDGPAATRAAIRSGLRNGLRNPRPLPDFSATPRRRTPTPGRSGPRRRPEPDQGERAAPGKPAPQAQLPSPATPEAGPGQSHRSGQATRRVEPTVRSVSAVLRSAGYLASSSQHRAAYSPEGYQVQEMPDGGILVRHVAIDDHVNGASPSARIGRMLAGYGHALADAGFAVTEASAGSLTVVPQPASPAADVHPESLQGSHAEANRIATAANDAYRVGDMDRARQLVDQAAELDPSRASLWHQHRSEIAARRLFLQARQAAAEGNRGRARKLIEDARQLDPRMQALWDGDLAGIRGGQRTRQARTPAPDGPGRGPDPAAPARQTSPEATHQEHSQITPGRPTWPDSPRRAHTRPDPATGGTPRTTANNGQSPQPRQRQGQRPKVQAPHPHRPPTATAPPPDREAGSEEAETSHAVASSTDGGVRRAAVEPAGEDAPPQRLGNGSRSPGATAREEAADWRDNVIAKGRQDWQPHVVQPTTLAPRPPQAAHRQAGGPEIGG